MKTSLSSTSEKKRRIQPAAEPVSQAKHSGKSMLPPALQLKASPIQREEKEEKKKEGPSKFQHNLSLLPPELQLKYWYLSLDADTQKAILKLKKDRGELGLGYEYGKDLSLSGKYGSFGGGFGINPGSKDMKFHLGMEDQLKFKGSYSPESGKYGLGLSGSHKGFKGDLGYTSDSGLSMGMGYEAWKLKGSANFGSNQYGLGFSYGAPLPPMPMDLSKSVHGGVAGMHDFMGGMPMDPLAMPGYYGSQGDNVEAMKKAGKDLHGLYQYGQGPGFGAAGDLAISPQELRFMLRFGGRF